MPGSENIVLHSFKKSSLGMSYFAVMINCWWNLPNTLKVWDLFECNIELYVEKQRNVLYYQITCPCRYTFKFQISTFIKTFLFFESMIQHKPVWIIHEGPMSQLF